MRTTSSSRNFHSLEDQGVPPATATALGVGVPILRSLVRNGAGLIAVVFTLLVVGIARLIRFFGGVFGGNARKQSKLFQSPGQRYPKMMCVIGIGRDPAA